MSADLFDKRTVRLSEVIMSWVKVPSIFSRQIDAIVYCQARHLIGFSGFWLGASEKRASEGKEVFSFAVPQSTESLAGGTLSLSII